MSVFTLQHSGKEQHGLNALQTFTWIALILLLVLRVPLTDIDSIVAKMSGSGSPPAWAPAVISLHSQIYYAYRHLGLLIVGIILLANRRRLNEMNVDIFFLVLFAWACFAYWRTAAWSFGWAVAIPGVLMPFAALRYKFAVRELRWTTVAAIPVIVAGLLVFLVCLRNTLDLRMLQSVIHWVILDNPPTAVVEEFTFRGLLWMVLRSLNWGDKWIIVTQAIVFWVAHTIYLFADPIAFWIIVPALSGILGIVVWKSKSLAVSATAHICINAAWSLLAYLGSP